MHSASSRLAACLILGLFACARAERSSTSPPPPRASGAESASAPGSAAAPAEATTWTELSEGERRALLEALDHEYRSLATYDQAVLDLGPARPFTRYRDAEASHIEALRTLLGHYDVVMPANPWPGRVARFSSTGQACAAGVEVEIATAARYQLLMHATRREGILAIFQYLERASQEHLPALRRCARGLQVSSAGRG